METEYGMKTPDCGTVYLGMSAENQNGYPENEWSETISEFDSDKIESKLVKMFEGGRDIH